MEELIIIEKPNSPFSEEIKRVRTNLKFSSVNNDMKVIMVTSSVPKEGKSFISANLAAAFAQADERVLLIDCDLRKGRLKKIFNVASRRTGGLSGLLINKNFLEDYPKYIKKTKVNNLFLISSGPFPPNPSELLASERFERLLDQLKRIFDVIILDCPPLTGLNDSLVVASRADISVLVARYKNTSMDLLNKSKKSLENVGANIAGVILNQTDVRGHNNYYYSYYTKDE